MEEVFVPNLMASYRWLSLCLIALLGGSVLAVMAYRRKDFPSRVAAQLLGALFALFGLLGGVMIGWDMLRTPIIVVTDDYAVLGRDTLRAAEIDRAYIRPLSEGPMAGAQETVDLGIVEYTDGSMSLFSQKNYDVKGLIGALRKLQERE